MALKWTKISLDPSSGYTESKKTLLSMGTNNNCGQRKKKTRFVFSLSGLENRQAHGNEAETLGLVEPFDAAALHLGRHLESCALRESLVERGVRGAKGFSHVRISL